MLSTLDHKTAEDRGYFKLDFLNVSLYKDLKDEEHLTKLMEKEPLWDLLTEQDFTNKLFHVGEHSTLLKKTEAEDDTRTSGDTSNNKTRKEISARQLLGGDTQGSLDKTK